MAVVLKDGVLYCDGEVIRSNIDSEELAGMLRLQRSELVRSSGPVLIIFLGSSDAECFPPRHIPLIRSRIAAHVLTKVHLKKSLQPLWDTLVESGFQPNIRLVTPEDEDDPSGFWLCIT